MSSSRPPGASPDVPDTRGLVPTSPLPDPDCSERPQPDEATDAPPAPESFAAIAAADFDSRAGAAWQRLLSTGDRDAALAARGLAGLFEALAGLLAMAASRAPVDIQAVGQLPPDVVRRAWLGGRLESHGAELSACLIAAIDRKPRAGKFPAARTRAAHRAARYYEQAFTALCRAIGLPVAARAARAAQRSGVRR